MLISETSLFSRKPDRKLRRVGKGKQRRTESAERKVEEKGQDKTEHVLRGVN